MMRDYHRGVSTRFTCLILLLAGFLFFMAAARLAAQDAEQPANDEWLVRVLQTEDGLPENTVDGVVQSIDGYLWIGTGSAFARFDGVKFETISLTNIIPLPNRGVITMIRGHRDSVWLAMDRGAVVRLSGDTSRAYVNELPSNLLPNGMAEDKEGNLWVAYRGGNVYCLKLDNRVVQITEKDGLPTGIDLCALACDNRGRVWYGKQGEVGYFTNGVCHRVQRVDALPMRMCAAQRGAIWLAVGFKVMHVDDDGTFKTLGEFHPANSGTAVTAIMEDHNSDVWVGTSFSGLYRCDASGFQSIPTSYYGISSLTEDRDGNIWVGTSGGGLNSVRRRAITLEGPQTGLPYPSVVSICEDRDGSIWAVTQNGVLVRKTGDEWIPMPVNDQWPGDATCVTADTNGTVWIGARTRGRGRGLYCYRDGKFVPMSPSVSPPGQTLHTLLVSRDGDLWMGREVPGGILRLHDGKLTSFPVSSASRVIRAMVQDVAGNIWVGTSRGNLLRITGDKITEATPRPADQLAPIRCLYTTPDGTLWIGYAGWGVGRLKDGHYTEFTTDQGLFDDSISHIVSDGQGWLWFGANRGLFKVREQDFENVAAGRVPRVRSIRYGRHDGLPSLTGTFGDSPDVLRSRDGRLWIPMLTGLIVADPGKLYEKIDPPSTLLTQVKVDDRVVAQYDSLLPGALYNSAGVMSLPLDNAALQLPPGHRSVEFQFTAFDYNAPENIQFRHQLTDVDPDWVDSGAMRSVVYPRLDAGKYSFDVAACNSDGDWSRGNGVVTLEVGQFFWRTWWFELLVGAAFTACIIAIVRYVSFRRLRAQLHVLEQQAALQRERARIAKDIHDDLGGTLTQIAFLGELANQDRDEPNAVAERIRKISASARQAVKSLDEIVWAVNPRNDTLAHLLDYAGQYAVDYLRLIGIRCRLDFPPEIPDRELSTDLRHNLFLVIKEALHNIFKHANATEVWMRVTADAQALQIVVEDNGRGFATTPDDALADGLRNMKQRMVDIGGDFRVESVPGAGTKIILRLPWPETE